MSVEAQMLPSDDMAAKIISPVMRVIGVTDPERSVSFYRDVLGFEIHENAGVTEAVSGPARLQFERDHATPDLSSVFFETDNIEATRKAIVARGGKPSQIEMVNWIKIEMFEVRDLDGHTLWFGQSYNQPAPERPAPMLEKALPFLPLDDVAAGAKYYCEVLGFHINHQQKDLAVLDRDEVTVVLIPRTARHHGIGSASFYVRNADELHAEFVAKGANVQNEPVSYPWGLRTFDVRDPEGNELRFMQPFE